MALAATKAEMKAAAKAAREEAKPRRRRRWPLVVLIAAIGAGVAYMRKAGSEVSAPATPAPPAPEPVRPAEKKAADEKPADEKAKAEGNGQSAPQKPATKPN